MAPADEDQRSPAHETRTSRLKHWSSRWKEAQQRQLNRPDTWLARYMAVVFCICLLVYCFYVYVGRVCYPMIRQIDPRGTRPQGIAFLSVFALLWLLMVYTYAAILFTNPGFARDYVSRLPCPEPPFPAPQPAYRVYEAPAQIPTTASTLGPASAQNTSEASWPSTEGTLRSALPPQEIAQQNIANNHAKTAAFGPGPAKLLSALDGARKSESQATSAEAGRTSLGSAPSFLHFPEPPIPEPAVRDTSDRARPFLANNGHGLAASRSPKVQRHPPLSAPLHPYFLWCSKCEHVKPPRTHHCRHCGTCILGMDHHCPWIGQCVGARNHIYFVTFCFWSSIALGYIFITLLVALIAPGTSPRPRLDGQVVAICALAGLLAFFVGSMCVTHIRLILLNQSTIESMAISDMKHAESVRLNKEYGLLDLREKHRVRKTFDQEWGKLSSEGNMWWAGSKGKNWRLVMGPSILAWILPPPRYRPDDGLHYTVNPRRGPQGAWRRRTEWPKELQ